MFRYALSGEKIGLKYFTPNRNHILFYYRANRFLIVEHLGDSLPRLQNYNYKLH